jgi:hypothetical protein
LHSFVDKILLAIFTSIINFISCHSLSHKLHFIDLFFLLFSIITKEEVITVLTLRLFLLL